MTSDPAAMVSVGIAVIAGIGIVVGILMMVLFLRILRVFRETGRSLAGVLHSLAPAPVITLDRRIPAGSGGDLDVIVTGDPVLPLQEMVIHISSQPGLDLEEDHGDIPLLEPAGQRIFRMRYGPLAEGMYIVRISVLYRAAGRERFSEFTFPVAAEAHGRNDGNIPRH